MAREPLKVLTESMFYVLLSLLRQERCGTEIVEFVDNTTAGRVPWTGDAVHHPGKVRGGAAH